MDTLDLDAIEVEEQKIALQERALVLEGKKLQLQLRKLRLLRQRKCHGMLFMRVHAYVVYTSV